jgi:hypothetical protein
MKDAKASRKKFESIRKQYNTIGKALVTETKQYPEAGERLIVTEGKE